MLTERRNSCCVWISSTVSRTLLEADVRSSKQPECSGRLVQASTCVRLLFSNSENENCVRRKQWINKMKAEMRSVKNTEMQSPDAHHRSVPLVQHGLFPGTRMLLEGYALAPCDDLSQQLFIVWDEILFVCLNNTCVLPQHLVRVNISAKGFCPELFLDDASVRITFGLFGVSGGCLENL